MHDSKYIGQKVLTKYILLALVICVLFPLLVILIAIVYYDAFSWPMNIGGKSFLILLYYTIAPILAVVVGKFLAKNIGQNVGILILEKGKSAYWVSSFALAITLITLLVFVLKPLLLVFGFILSFFLGYFMSLELKSKGK